MDKESIIELLAAKHNKTKKEILEVIDSQYKCLAHVMKRGRAEPVRLPYWGVYNVHPYRLKKLKENSNGQTLRKLS